MTQKYFLNISKTLFMVKIVFFNDVPKSRHISCVLEIFCSKLYSKFVFDGHHVHKAAQLLKKIPSESKYLALIQLGIPAPSFANCFPSSRPVSLVHSQNFFYIGPYRRRSFAPLIYLLTFGLSSFFLWQTNLKNWPCLLNTNKSINFICQNNSRQNSLCF